MIYVSGIQKSNSYYQLIIKLMDIQIRSVSYVIN